MKTGLDVRSAVRDANEVFGRYTARIAVLPVLMGLFGYATTAWMPPDYYQNTHDNPILVLLFIFGGGFVLFWINYFIEVVVSSMYLRAREGEEPGTKQVGEVWQYRGFASVAGGLFLRCLGWGGLLGLAFGVLLLLAGIFSNIANKGGSTSGIVATAGGVGHGFDIVIGVIVMVGFVLIATRIFCRYMFIFPMYAIERGGGSGFLDECVARTEEAWKTAALVTIAGGIPTCLIMGLESLAWWHWTPPHGVHLAVEVAGAILTGCFTAWFILVKTGLAIQLMTAPAAAIEPVGDGAAI